MVCRKGRQAEQGKGWARQTWAVAEEGLNSRRGQESQLDCNLPRAWAQGPGGVAPPRHHCRLPWSGDLIAKYLQHKGCELHATLRLEGDGTILFGVFLIEASQVSQLLDHFSIELVAAWRWVTAADIGLQRVG